MTDNWTLAIDISHWWRVKWEEVPASVKVVIIKATEGDDFIATKADHVIYVPKAPSFLLPVLTVLPLQRLAYEIAVWRGADVDQPRNLAKSVTVE